VYTQVKLPPLIPPWKGWKPENLIPSPCQGYGVHTSQITPLNPRQSHATCYNGGNPRNAVAPQVGKPFRQSLMGETPKTALPHPGAGSPWKGWTLENIVPSP
jgi:hypothetical protein